MQRRDFLKGLFSSAAIAVPSIATAGNSITKQHIVIQEAWLAGYDQHMGDSVWPLLSKGDPLVLRRETHNAFDQQAVSVHWNGLQLGYLPREQNTAIAQMLDRGNELESCIVALNEAAGPDERLRFCVCLAA